MPTYGQKPNPAELVPYCAAVNGIVAYSMTKRSTPDMEGARVYQQRAAIINLEGQKYASDGPAKFMRQLDYMKLHLGEKPDFTADELFKSLMACDKYLPTLGIKF